MLREIIIDGLKPTQTLRSRDLMSIEHHDVLPAIVTGSVGMA